MSGGTGNDTIFVSKGIGSTFQGDLGHDSLYFSDSSFNNSTVYGGNTSDATSADGSTLFGSVELLPPATSMAMVVMTPFMSVEQL